MTMEGPTVNGMVMLLHGVCSGRGKEGNINGD